MVDKAFVKLTINFNDSNLSTDERDDEAQRLLNELKSMDEIESIGRVLDSNPPEDSKAIGAWLAGLLMAEVNVTNAKAVLGYLGNRLGGKPIELEIEANGRKLKVKAHSQEELIAVIEAAKNFITT